MCVFSMEKIFFPLNIFIGSGLNPQRGSHRSTRLTVLCRCLATAPPLPLPLLPADRFFLVFLSLGALASKSKKPCIQYLPPEKPCDSPASSHGSTLDSPATPSAALASPAAPAATHSEQAQPLSLTTKPETRAQLALHSAAFLAAKATASNSSQMGSQPPLLSRPLPLGSVPTALLTSPPSFPATLHAHQALPVLQAQPLSLVTKSAH